MIRKTETAAAGGSLRNTCLSCFFCLFICLLMDQGQKTDKECHGLPRKGRDLRPLPLSMGGSDFHLQAHVRTLRVPLSG